MKNLNLRSLGSPALLAPGLTGLILGGLLLGIEPVGGDPDRLYRPIKEVLAESLARDNSRCGATGSGSACRCSRRATPPRSTLGTGCSTRS